MSEYQPNANESEADHSFMNVEAFRTPRSEILNYWNSRLLSQSCFLLYPSQKIACAYFRHTKFLPLWLKYISFPLRQPGVYKLMTII